MNPFDFVKSINNKTGNLIDSDPEVEKDYNPFLVNRALSNFPDTVLCANAMNTSHHLSKKMQYDYLYTCIKRKPRFSKWIKSTEDDMEQVVMDYYKVSRTRAKEYLAMMSETDIEDFKKLTYTGGRNSK